MPKKRADEKVRIVVEDGETVEIVKKSYIYGTCTYKRYPERRHRAHAGRQAGNEQRREDYFQRLEAAKKEAQLVLELCAKWAPYPQRPLGMSVSERAIRAYVGNVVMCWSKDITAKVLDVPEGSVRAFAKRVDQARQDETLDAFLTEIEDRLLG